MNAETDLPRRFARAGLGAGRAAPADATARRGRTRPARLALFGLFGGGNFGNAASLEVMVDFLRRTRPDAELSCICEKPEVVARIYGIETSPIRRPLQPRWLPGGVGRILKLPVKLAEFVEACWRVREIDTMIIPGTGILDDFGERPLGMPFDIFKWCLAARIAGARIAFVSIGAGPIRHPLSRWLMTAAARLAHYRSYRDAISRDFMTGAGLDGSRDPVFPDLVFKLPQPAAEPRARGGRLEVGVGVMTYRGWYDFAEGGAAIFDRYAAKLTRFVLHLLDDGHAVRLLTGETTDSAAVQRILQSVREVRPGARIVAEPIASLDALMRQMARTDVVVATRFHNVVCALKMARPTISLGYAAKNDVLMQAMGLGAYCHHVEHFDVEALIAQFARIRSQREAIEHDLRRRNRAFRAALERQDADLLSTTLALGDDRYA